MRNHENNFSRQTRAGRTGWENMEGGHSGQHVAEESNQESIDDDSEQRGIPQTEWYKEGLGRSKEAKAIMMKKAKVLAVSAIASVALIGAVVASGVFSTNEIMNSKKIVGEMNKVEGVVSVVAKDGPNLRKEPFVSGRDEPETFIIDLGEEGQTAMFFWQGKDVYRYENKNDPNGYWIGFNAEDLADTLFKNNYITSKEAERINNKDKDGMVWFNGNYIELKGNNITYNTVDSDSISSLNSN